MNLRRFVSALCGCALVLCLGLFLSGQEVTSNIVGTVVDSSGAVVPGASVKLTDVANGAVRTATSSRDGVFRFPNLSASTYIATITANGFQTHNVSGIILGASSTRDLGKVTLSVGSQSQEVSVTAAATPIQTSSSEVSHTIQGSALDSLPLVGRDVFGAMKLDPGVVSNTNNFDTGSEGDIGQITIDGNTSAKNFTVDGVTDLDTGSNGTTHYEPNEDAIQEVKILSSNYDAEYGRNSGGTITVITKSGTNKFHGSLWANHRHEQFNANTYFNNQRGLPRSLYRYNIDGWSFGGPVALGWLKNRLFFFGSQEYTNQLGSNTVMDRISPTVAERTGDFSSSVDGNGKPIVIFDPLTKLPFPNNTIPTTAPAGETCGVNVTCVDTHGQALLNFFPKPNFTPAAGSNLVNQANFQTQASAAHPHRNDVLRIDFNPTSKLTSYFRWIRDVDDQNAPFGPFNTDQFVYAPIDHPNPGHGYAWSATYVLSPTLINTTTVGKSWNTWSWYFEGNSLSLLGRANVGNPPLLFPLPAASGINGYENLMPSFSFGGNRPNMMSHNTNGLYNYYNANNIWTLDDDVSKVWGAHQFKTGIYVEYNTKLQPAGNGYAGSYNFGTDFTNPNSTAGTCTNPAANTNPGCGPAGTTVTSNGDGYANAMIGAFSTFNQQTARTVFNVAYWNVEFYGQDSWRISKKLTLDLGVRFYHQTPQLDTNGTFGEFIPSSYVNPMTASPTTLGKGILYTPGCDTGGVISTGACSSGTVVAVNPNDTSVHGPAAYIGAFLPTASSYFGASNYDGMKTLSATQPPYTNSALVAAPRIGFAYDVFGNGRTALRGGFGVFYNRLDGNQVYGMSGQPPLVLNYTVSQATMAGIANGSVAGVIAPGGVSYYSGNTPIPVVKNASLNWQQELGYQTSLSVGWVGNYSTNQNVRENLNAVPLGANFNPANISPVTGKALTQNSSALERPNFPGYLDLNREVFYGHSNYNALQVSLQHRLVSGVLFGAAYTWSRALGVTSYDPLFANNNARNYGPLGSNRDQTLVLNYSWALPGVGDNPVGALLNHWTFAGLGTFETGAPYNIGFNAGGTDYTGSTNESPRPNEIGNPLQNVPAGSILNIGALAVPTPGPTGYGNLGNNAFSYPGWWDIDMAFTKFIPVGFNEGSGLSLQVQAYNVFNHPQFTGWGTNMSFASSFGLPNNTQEPRILAFNLRYQF